MPQHIKAYFKMQHNKKAYCKQITSWKENAALR